MDRRKLLLTMTAGIALSTAANAQEAVLDDVDRNLMTLNGYSTSSEIIEMTLGSASAPTTMEVYASFTCPHCANFHNGALALLRRDYVETGRLRVVYRDVFLDRPGLWASMMARCAGPDRFFDAADLLYHNQSVWTEGDTPTILGFLAEIGSRVGMSDADLEACYTNTELASNLVAWSDRERLSARVNSTPTLVINGKLYPNMSYEQIVAIID